MIIYLIIVIHVLVSLGLILAILLHSGKGAGLSNVFGGGLPSTFSGTSMIEKNLDRITIGLAVTFALTTFVLMLTVPKELTSTTPPGQPSQTTTATPGGPTPAPQQQTPAPGTPGEAPSPGGQTPAPSQSKP